MAARRCRSAALLAFVVALFAVRFLRRNRCARWSAVLLAIRWQCARCNARDAGPFDSNRARACKALGDRHTSLTGRLPFSNYFSSKPWLHDCCNLLTCSNLRFRNLILVTLRAGFDAAVTP